MRGPCRAHESSTPPVEILHPRATSSHCGCAAPREDPAMPRYMLLLYANEAAGAQVSPEDMAMWMGKMGEYADALKKADAFVSTGGLGRTGSARTIHANKDGLQVHN